MVDSKPFDFSSFRKIWHSETLQSEVEEISTLIQFNHLLHSTLILNQSALAVLDIRTMQYPLLLVYVSHMPPADYQGLEAMNKLIGEYIVTLSESQAQQFRAIFDYKMIRSDGSICRIIQESIALKRDSNGNILFFLAIASDISNLKRDNRQHLRLTDGKENLLYEVNNITGI
mgnify:CR=1 FL=1